MITHQENQPTVVGAGRGLETLSARSDAGAIKVLHVVHWPNSGITNFLQHFLKNAKDNRFRYFAMFFIQDEEEGIQFRRFCEEVYSLDFGDNVLAGLSKYAKVVRALRPEIIHTHSFQPGLWGRIFSIGTGAAIVSTIHSPYPYLNGGGIRDRVKRFIEISGINSRNARVACVSEGVRTHVCIHTGINVEKTEVIRNGIALSQGDVAGTAHAKRELAADGASKIIITAGRLSEEKGLDILLRAFAQILKKMPDVLLAILGTGALEERLKAQAAALGVESRVRFLGFKKDITPYLALSDVYASSSYYEGLPMSVLEAMAAGLPVAATSVGGTPEVVEDKTTGILVEPGNPEALAHALLTILQNESLSAELKANGRRKVRRHFDILETVRAYENLYLKLQRSPVMGEITCSKQR